MGRKNKRKVGKQHASRSDKDQTYDNKKTWVDKKTNEEGGYEYTPTMDYRNVYLEAYYKVIFFY